MGYFFLGTGSFGASVLKELCLRGEKPRVVYTAQSGATTMVGKVAQRPRLKVEGVGGPDHLALLKALGPEARVLLVDYGKKLPPALLEASRFGIWDLHPSLLPRWRGAAPIVRAIMAGDRETGVCLMVLNQEIDRGELIACRSTPIDERETAGQLAERLAIIGSELFVAKLKSRQPPATRKQRPGEACYAKKLTKREYHLGWSDGATELHNKIRALAPVPGARSKAGGEDFQIMEAETAANGASAEPGTIVGSDRYGIKVATGAGVLVVKRIKLPGGREISPHTLQGKMKLRFSEGRRLG